VSDVLIAKSLINPGLPAEQYYGRRRTTFRSVIGPFIGITGLSGPEMRALLLRDMCCAAIPRVVHVFCKRPLSLQIRK
jgi:hypothetical protein